MSVDEVNINLKSCSVVIAHQTTYASIDLWVTMLHVGFFRGEESCRDSYGSCESIPPGLF